jgi:putative transposase
MTKRAQSYRFYPTPEQADLLARRFGCVRFVYNAVLHWRTGAFQQEQQRIGYNQASARLTCLKKEPDTLFLNEGPAFPAAGIASPANGVHPRLNVENITDKTIGHRPTVVT